MAQITDQVIDFYDALFLRVFLQAFSARIPDRRRRDAVRFQVLEAAGAASQSLERFFVNQQLTSEQIECVLGSLEMVSNNLTLERISNPYTPPEIVVDELLRLPICTIAQERVIKAEQEAVYRVALYSVVQGLMQVGPVMVEWQKIGFPTTFELTKRVVARLNEISAQLDVLGSAGSDAVDERYELQYRDYLSQRFYRVEAGTVKMTTNLSVDLRELFVMPNVLERVGEGVSLSGESGGPPDLMPLAQARKVMANAFGKTVQTRDQTETAISVLEQVTRQPRNVIVGAPGSGKSTFLEWFQLKVANAEEPFLLAGGQAIPLMLRVRQLDPCNLPSGASMIEKATGSKDFAALMPDGWLQRQMTRGAIVLMLDGLDEVEPSVRDAQIVPWFEGICQRYPECSFILSSRPVGYPSGLLRRLAFSECELLDFTPQQTLEFARHWCTAIRLARNESQAESRREGENDGDRIVQGFKGHPYIESLARNPLMLSAICLVNYFEGGELPKDRVVLYKLCVEGLLHNWDQRRGIFSDFTLEEKVRASREVALRMQAGDRAECDLNEVQDVFSLALKNSGRAAKLLEHVRYRTGLLLERRPGVFAFAHLTFQEYLAACAIHEGNHSGVDSAQLLREHGDARWQEVIALYCGIVPAPVARRFLEDLLTVQEVKGALLAEAYFAAGPELALDVDLRKKVIRANAERRQPGGLHRFSVAEVAPIANEMIGTINLRSICVAYLWLVEHPDRIDFTRIVPRLLQRSKDIGARARTELNMLVHQFADDKTLEEVACNPDLYFLPGYLEDQSQGEIALSGLCVRERSGPGADAAFMQALTAVLTSATYFLQSFDRPTADIPSARVWAKCGPLVKQHLRSLRSEPHMDEGRVRRLTSWFETMNRKYATPSTKAAAKGRRKRLKQS